MAALIDVPNEIQALPSASPEIQEMAQSGVTQHEQATAALKAAMKPELFKGWGFRPQGGNKPLEDQHEIAAYTAKATMDTRVAAAQGYRSRGSVVKSMNPVFLNKYGALKAALERPSVGDQMQAFMAAANPELAKSFTAGNIGINSVYGLTPFNLLAPSRLIYPVYTVYRNKFARVPSQGASTMERVFTGISGSQTGGQGVVDISLPELVQQGGSFGNWPLNLPPAGAQTMVPLNIPDRFMGITEQLSWLAQFAGQGYEDLSALANLIMLQEMMLGEEYLMIAGTSAPLPTPAAATLTVRSAQSNETALSTSTHFTVYVTAVNYFGQTTAVASADAGAISAGQVVDVTIATVAGTMQYNIFVSTNSSPTLSNAFLMATTGATKYTLQGTVPSSGSNPPSADTGTGKGTRIEGVIPTLTGQSAAAGVYPSGWQGGYINNAVASHLSINVVNTALKALIDAPGGSTTNGAFKADPAEIVSSGTDIANLANDILSAGAANNYLLGISQDQVGNVTAGVAVTQFKNPITQSMVKLVWHPWYTPGSADLLSYQLPQTWTNVGNAIEMQMVYLRPLAGQPASANPENCWDARVTCVRYSVN